MPGTETIANKYVETPQGVFELKCFAADTDNLPA
jgi:DNA-directed RNA polymerase specialized sigma54-like protein